MDNTVDASSTAQPNRVYALYILLKGTVRYEVYKDNGIFMLQLGFGNFGHPVNCLI